MMKGEGLLNRTWFRSCCAGQGLVTQEAELVGAASVLGKEEETNGTLGLPDTKTCTRQQAPLLST